MRRLPIVLAALAVLLAVPGAVLSTVLGYQDLADLPFAVGFALMGLASAGTGAVVASRAPGNAVGWLILGLGVGVGGLLATGAYAEPGRADRGALPAQDLAAWLSDVLSVPVFFGITGFLLLLFPTGHLVTRRWRAPARVFGLVLLLATVSRGLQPGPVGAAAENPFGVGGTLGEVARVVADVTDVLALPAMLSAALALVVRMRRSRGVERQQLKAFSFVAAVAGLGLGLTVLSSGVVADVTFLVGLLGVAAMPVTAGVAILRYRLYDIDGFIIRAVVYGALTATLAATYLGSVLLLQLALSPLTDQSDLAVAAATLGVAALFRPARAHIQVLVDRRFYRHRYDAVRTLESFAGRLRQDVDLASVSADLRAVIRETVQPAHVSLWLRSAP